MLLIFVGRCRIKKPFEVAEICKAAQSSNDAATVAPHKAGHHSPSYWTVWYQFSISAACLISKNIVHQQLIIVYSIFAPKCRNRKWQHFECMFWTSAMSAACARMVIRSVPKFVKSKWPSEDANWAGCAICAIQGRDRRKKKMTVASRRCHTRTRLAENTRVYHIYYKTLFLL